MVAEFSRVPAISALHSLFMVQLSRPETVLFLVLLIASLYGFWVRFGKVWRTVLASKKDPDFTIQPAARRTRDFVWEVLLQGKVIQQRPLPGLAHALVFWGFCAFALITVNHFAEGANFGLLRRDTWPGKVYFWLALVFAIGVVSGITGLFIRRFFVRPRWLGKVSYESGFIAFLIFMLMATYLATFAPGW